MTLTVLLGFNAGLATGLTAAFLMIWISSILDERNKKKKK